MSARSRSRRPLAAAAGLWLVAGLLTGCPGPDPEPSASPSTTPTPTAEPSQTVEPEPEPTASSTAELWFQRETGLGVYLVRELQDVADPSIETAVAAMIAGPVDPDYHSPWAPTTQVLGVTEAGGTVTVDLSADAEQANVGSAGASLMVQQLIWTVSAAAGDPATPVALSIEGVPATELWGAVEWSGPRTRDDALGTRLMVQIDEPRQGAVTTSPVTVTGDAAVFEANLPWRVLDADGTEVAAGSTMTAEGQTFAPYSFDLDLAPGTYTIVVVEDDPSGGEGRPPHEDSKVVTVE